MEGIEEVFEDLDEPRSGNAKRHMRHEVLVIALCTVLCGGESSADMALFGRSKRAFLQEFLRLEHGTQRHDTFSRVFRLLDPAGLPNRVQDQFPLFPAESLHVPAAVLHPLLERDGLMPANGP